MLLAGKAEELKWAVLTKARKYQPDGILNAKDLRERYFNTKDVPSYPYPDSMPILNHKTCGVRDGMVVTLTSGTGGGKTQILREMKYHFWSTTDKKIADVALEEDVKDTMQGMIALHLNKRIMLPDVEVPEEVEDKAFTELFESGRFELYDHFGGMDDENLFSKLRYLIDIGHDMIFLDHLSIIVSEFAAKGGERERIDTIMTRLAKLAKETGAIIFLVVHLSQPDKSNRRSFEEGLMPTLDDLRGSSQIKCLSWDVIAMARDQQHHDRNCANTVELSVLKCRLTGRTGQAGFLKFDDRSGRMFETTKPSNYDRWSAR